MDDKKKKLLLLVLFGVAAIAATLFLTETNPPPANPSPADLTASTSQAVSNSAAKSAKPALPEGAAGVGQMVRDIFSPPAEYAARLQLPKIESQRGSGGPQSFSSGPVPVLTGVIAGQGSRVVILRQGTVSRSYRVGESSGSYRVDAIGSNAVTLTGPTGTIVLMMGQ